MCAGPMLIIKNTFITAVDGEDVSPVSFTRQRAVTSPELHDLLSCASTGTPTSAADDSSAVPDFFGSGDGAASFGEEASQRSSQLASTALDRRGSVVLRRAIEEGQHESVPDIVAALRGRVLEASRCAYGHEVLLTAIHYLRVADSAFIAEELLGHGREVALNSNGSLVVCQLLAFCADDASTAALIDEIAASDISEMACHKFGHRVAGAVLEYGRPHQRDRVVRGLLENVQRFARHRFASPVVEAAVLRAPAADGVAVCAGLTSHQGAVVALACHGFGVRVVRALLQVDGVAERVVECLRQGHVRVAKDKYGLQLLRSLGLEYPAVARAFAGAVATVAAASN